jgi:hypothetical protein
MSTTTAAATTTTTTTETNENTSYRCGNDGGREGEGAEQQSGSKDIQLHVDVMRMRIYRRERKLMALLPFLSSMAACYMVKHQKITHSG